MSKNGWYACIIVLIVVSCACVFCVMVSLIGIAAYRSVATEISQKFPALPVDWNTYLYASCNSSLIRGSCFHTGFASGSNEVFARQQHKGSRCYAAACGAHRYHQDPGKYLYSDQ